MSLDAPLELEPLTVRAPHVLVVGNEKGGAGKSTVAMHLIVSLLRTGRRVAAIDLDLRQRTLTRYLQNRTVWAKETTAALAMPLRTDLRASSARDLDAAAAEEAARFEDALMDAAAAQVDVLVIDAPGSDTHFSRLAHAAADTLISPMNDSFIDFDLLGEINPQTFEVIRPSFYAELVWESRKRKAQASRRPIDWVVMRNRIAPGTIESKNRQRVGEALKALSSRIGFRIAPGLTERMIFRELFPKGLTLLDLDDPRAAGDMTITHVAARQELRDLLIVLKLPGMEGEPLRF